MSFNLIESLQVKVFRPAVLTELCLKLAIFCFKLGKLLLIRLIGIAQAAVLTPD